jgi:glucokinase
MMLLAGDIGGTKTDLAVFSPEAGPRAPLAQAEFHSADYPSLDAMARSFLAQGNHVVHAACFDVAGPVVDGHVKLTNLPWTLDEDTLRGGLHLDAVHLPNDLQAVAYAVPLLQPNDLFTLNVGTAAPGGAVAVIAPGTGLGEAFLVWDGTRYQAYPSEGGHADFAPTSCLQDGLLEYMQALFDHVSYEHVCSGIGIPHLYGYLRQRGEAPESPALAQALAQAADPTRLIVEAALRPGGPDGLSAATLELFITILGAEASNLALKVLATGGVYLAGGIPARIRPLLADGRFLDAFRRKGRFAELLSHIPVHVIVERAALIGAAGYGLSLARNGEVAD